MSQSQSGMNYRMNKRVLYLVQAVPGDNAPTKHAFAVSDLLVKCGFSVHFVLAGIIDPSSNAIITNYDYPFDFPNEVKLGHFQIAKKYYERISSSFSFKAFARIFNLLQPDLVIYYGIQHKLAKKVLDYCHNTNVPVIVDETDWFTPKYKGDLAAWLVEKSRSKRVAEVDKLLDGVIAISPFFKKHFDSICSSQGYPKTFYLPPLNRTGDSLGDPSSIGMKHRTETKFVYAGSPAGGKDSLTEFISLISQEAIPATTQPVLDVLGIDLNQAISLMGDIAKSDKVHFHGRVSHDSVIKLLQDSDFGILFRTSDLYARAGFSTKFAECMSNGVPMLCNAVGGADLILENNIDGIVIPDLSSQALHDGITSACNLTDYELANMKQAALKKALSLFESDNYIDSFSSFLKSVLSISN